ncbi:MAG: hypothetical protein M0011_02820 [Elusimicrobia bacterium]|nr:hypothetical protein [Elusimicrobiota bacterium]
MTLIYLRNHTPKAKKFIKKKLRGDEPSSIYDIEAGDCCLAPAHDGSSDRLVTFVNDVTPEMVDFIWKSAGWANLSQN